MNQNATWYEGGSRPKQHCIRWKPSSTSPKRGTDPPIFGPCLLWPKGWKDQDATWHGDTPRPRPHCVRPGPTSPLRKGHSSPPPLFGPCLLWPRSPISATAELFFQLQLFIFSAVILPLQLQPNSITLASSELFGASSELAPNQLV